MRSDFSLNSTQLYLKKNLKGSRPSEHPPIRGNQLDYVTKYSVLSLRTGSIKNYW